MRCFYRERGDFVARGCRRRRRGAHRRRSPHDRHPRGGGAPASTTSCEHERRRRVFAVPASDDVSDCTVGRHVPHAIWWTRTAEHAVASVQRHAAHCSRARMKGSRAQRGGGHIERTGTSDRCGLARRDLSQGAGVHEAPPASPPDLA